MKFSPRARWAVPAGALAAVGAVMAGALIGTAQASPALPARTPAQLLAAVAGRTGPLPALTGTVVESAALGLPDLPGTDNPSSITSLLTGSHTVRVWYADPRHFRLAMPGMTSESDLIVNGRTAWYWQSTTNSVTRYVLPARDHPADHGPAPAMALTPQQAARQALAAVGPSTRVTVQNNVTVAGEAAYQLVLAPRSASSLIGQVRIAIDAAHNVPLRVQIFARGAQSPAFRCRLHLDLVRAARRVELQLQPAARRQGEDGHAPAERLVRPGSAQPEGPRGQAQGDGPGLADRGRAAGLGAVRDGRRGGLRRRRRGIGGAVRRG